MRQVGRLLQILACQVLVAQLVALLMIGVFPSTGMLIIGSLIYGFAIGHVTTLSPDRVAPDVGHLMRDDQMVLGVDCDLEVVAHDARVPSARRH